MKDETLDLSIVSEIGTGFACTKMKDKEELEMTTIALLRIDDRLVHGQVVTKWLQESGAKKIVIVDDVLATNAYLSKVYKMAAPQGIDVDTYSAADFVQQVQSDTFGEVPLLVLLKSVESLKKIFDHGFFTSKVQIGGVGASAGKKLVYHTIAMNLEEAKVLQGLSEKGVEIYFQRVPDDRLQTLEAIVQKNF
ncbi:PTS sugar transporter subunit IIB [Enterococcus casseliflavus]|uniref:PTS sugar transporter subunit IIB n=2 Tax=Enterococcus TaxID=1350 RepID=UPI0021B0466C|nr:PTS sugar transporter subunit IIB [Enterococcus casseliflavus]